MKVELLYWEGCPAHPKARALLERVLADHGDATPIELRNVTTQEEAEELAFPGSPTIRIDGRDIDPVGASSPPALACRIYRVADGRISATPSREALERALAHR